MAERNDRGGKPRREGSAGRPDRGRPEGQSRNRGGSRPARPARETDQRPEWQTRVAPKVRADKPKSPPVPEEITPADLQMPIRVQLKTLSAENAEMTARHLAMVDLLIEQDPELAHQHAQAAAGARADVDQPTAAEGVRLHASAVRGLCRHP